MHATGAPGEVRLYRRDEMLKNPPQPRLSPHDPGLKEALLTLEFSGTAPREVLLVGVIPASVETGVGLSPAVQRGCPARGGRGCDGARQARGRAGRPRGSRAARSLVGATVMGEPALLCERRGDSDGQS